MVGILTLRLTDHLVLSSHIVLVIRPVAGTFGAPVLTTGTRIGRPGTARPMQASTTDHLLPKPVRAR
jgi:hypothetical protein